MGKKITASTLAALSILSSVPSFSAKKPVDQNATQIVEIKDTPQSTDLSDKQIEEFGKLTGKTPEEAKSFLQKHPKIKKL